MSKYPILFSKEFIINRSNPECDQIIYRIELRGHLNAMTIRISTKRITDEIYRTKLISQLSYNGIPSILIDYDRLTLDSSISLYIKNDDQNVYLLGGENMLYLSEKANINEVNEIADFIYNTLQELNNLYNESFWCYQNKKSENNETPDIYYVKQTPTTGNKCSTICNNEGTNVTR